MEVVGQGGATVPRKSCVGDSQALGTRLLSAPHQEDYRRTVTEIDEKEYISLRLIISELRNQYVSYFGPCPQFLWLFLVLVAVFLPLSRD